MTSDVVTLDFAFGLSAVRIGANTLLLTRDEAAAWRAVAAAAQANPQDPARPLIVRSGPQAQAAIAEMIETQARVGQGVQQDDGVAALG